MTAFHQQERHLHMPVLCGNGGSSPESAHLGTLHSTSILLTCTPNAALS